MRQYSLDVEEQNNKIDQRENEKMNATIAKAFWVVITLLCLIIAVAVLVPYVRTTVTDSITNPPVIPTSYIQLEQLPQIQPSEAA